ncbi:hypothetical protein TSOC_008491 [Tetrabaena socialis]|uniref:Uncharacterized protein n=1 Tax=Tetrabaena socialis TaxID=47790 RepID=A0A2J7ZYB5_9CHLO|nr:hypothetical protein TSOC_008491 [Tetrabaena socialis]|eukprot:PNH05259.1 hypothetical protein TSOC_008491 [Tetrabaena socialis]
MDAGPSGASSSIFGAGDHTRWLQSKLSGDWSAPGAASGLTEERLTTLGQGQGPGGQGATAGLDSRSSLGGSAPGPSGDPLARRGLGGGETSVLRSRADISHKLLNQFPPTPSAKSGSGAPPSGLAMRPSRPRPQLITDGASAAGGDGMQPSPANQPPPGGADAAGPPGLGIHTMRAGSLPASAPAGGAVFGGGFGGGPLAGGAGAAVATSTAVGLDEQSGPEPRGEWAAQHHPPEDTHPQHAQQQPLGHHPAPFPPQLDPAGQRHAPDDPGASRADRGPE